MMVELFNEKHIFKGKIVFSYLLYNIITLMSLKKKTTQLMSRVLLDFYGVIRFLFFYTVLLPHSSWGFFFPPKVSGILGVLILVFLQLFHGVKSILVFL